MLYYVILHYYIILYYIILYDIILYFIILWYFYVSMVGFLWFFGLGFTTSKASERLVFSPNELLPGGDRRTSHLGAFPGYDGVIIRLSWGYWLEKNTLW